MCTLCRHSKSNTWQVKPWPELLCCCWLCVTIMQDAELLSWMLCVPRDVCQSWLRKGMAPALPCTVWCEVCLQGASEAQNCHFACPSALGTTSSSLQPFPAASYSLLSPTPIHSRLCVPLLLLQPLLQPLCHLSLGYGERSWAYLSSSAHAPAEWHPELGPLLLAPVVCQQPLVLPFPREKTWFRPCSLGTSIR